MAQEHGKQPVPSFRIIEPVMEIEAKKAEGNEAFKAGDMEAALAKYTEALGVANECEGAHGIDDDLLGKLYGNRAEACLQLGQYDKCIADADLALEYDPCFVKGFVRKAKACTALDDHETAQQCLKDALDVAPNNKEVLSMQDEYRVLGLARSGKDTVLTELSGLCSRLTALLKRKGTALEVRLELARLDLNSTRLDLTCTALDVRLELARDVPSAVTLAHPHPHPHPHPRPRPRPHRSSNTKVPTPPTHHHAVLKAQPSTITLTSRPRPRPHPHPHPHPHPAPWPIHPHL